MSMKPWHKCHRYAVRPGYRYKLSPVHRKQPKKSMSTPHVKPTPKASVCGNGRNTRWQDLAA